LAPTGHTNTENQSDAIHRSVRCDHSVNTICSPISRKLQSPTATHCPRELIFLEPLNNCVPRSHPKKLLGRDSLLSGPNLENIIDPIPSFAPNFCHIGQVSVSEYLGNMSFPLFRFRRILKSFAGFSNVEVVHPPRGVSGGKRLWTCPKGRLGGRGTRSSPGAEKAKRALGGSIFEARRINHAERGERIHTGTEVFLVTQTLFFFL